MSNTDTTTDANAPAPPSPAPPLPQSLLQTLLSGSAGQQSPPTPYFGIGRRLTPQPLVLPAAVMQREPGPTPWDPQQVAAAAQTAPRLPPFFPQSFIPAMQPTQPSQWGQPDVHLLRSLSFPGVDPSPFMPQRHQIPGIIRGIGGLLARFGSRGVGLSSISMMNNFSAFVQGYLRGQLLRAQLAKGQFQDAMNQTIWNQRKELLDARELFATYDKDPNQLQQQLQQLARQTGDQYLYNAATMGVEQAKAVLSQKNAWLGTLMKTKAQTAKSGDDLSAWGISSAGSDTQDPFAPSKPATAAAPGVPVAPAGPPANPAATMAGTVDGAQAGPDDAAAQAAADARDAQFDAHFGPQAHGMATAGRTLFEGGSLDPGTPKQIESAATAYANQLRAEGMNIAATCEGIDGENGCVSRLTKLDPLSGQNLRGIITNSVDTTSGSWGAKNVAYRTMIRNLALRATGGKWSEQGFKNVERYKDPNGHSFTNLSAASRMGQAAAQVLWTGKAIGVDTYLPQNIAREVAAGAISNDPRWRAFTTAWADYVMQSVRVSRGGQGAEHDILRLLKIAPPTTVSGVFAAMQQDAADAAGSVAPYQAQWLQDTYGLRGDAPGLDAVQIKNLNAIGSQRFDPTTGTFRGKEPVPKALVDRKAAFQPIQLSDGNPPRSPPRNAAPKPGFVKDGYRYTGGDPADPANWVKVQ